MMALIDITRLIELCLMLVAVWVAYLLVESWSLSAGRLHHAAALLLAVVVFFARMEDRVFLTLYGYDDMVYTDFTNRMVELSPQLPAAALVAATVLATLLTCRFVASKHGRITPDSIKEAVDALPDGVCFSAEDGTPLLVNELMGELAHSAFGTALMNERVLWERLCAGECAAGYSVERADALDAGKGILLVADDGRAWQFSRRRLDVEGRPVIETIAADVAQEYALAKHFEERNRRLAAVNEHLRAYGRNLAQLVREEEILTMKAQVHNDVGRALTALRTYERQDLSQRDRKALLGYWNGVAHLLEGSAKEEAMDSWSLLAKAADAIGVDLKLSGELPAEKEARDLAVMVVHECLNNAVLHGDAHRVDVACSVAGDAVELVVANDGAVPSAPPEEVGGLANLRAILKRAGGTLATSWEPQVRVRARFCLRGGA